MAEVVNGLKLQNNSQVYLMLCVNTNVNLIWLITMFGNVIEYTTPHRLKTLTRDHVILLSIVLTSYGQSHESKYHLQ